MPTEAQLRQLFEDIDVDESGLLDRGEVADLAESLGCPLSTTELDEAMAEMDEDQSGEVDFDEFQSWFEKMEKVEQQDGGSKWASALKGKLEDYQGKVSQFMGMMGSQNLNGSLTNVDRLLEFIPPAASEEFLRRLVTAAVDDAVVAPPEELLEGWAALMAWGRDHVLQPEASAAADRAAAAARAAAATYTAVHKDLVALWQTDPTQAVEAAAEAQADEAQAEAASLASAAGREAEAVAAAERGNPALQSEHLLLTVQQAELPLARLKGALQKAVPAAAGWDYPGDGAEGDGGRQVVVKFKTVGAAAAAAPLLAAVFVQLAIPAETTAVSTRLLLRCGKGERLKKRGVAAFAEGIGLKVETGAELRLSDCGGLARLDFGTPRQALTACHRARLVSLS